MHPPLGPSLVTPLWGEQRCQQQSIIRSVDSGPPTGPWALPTLLGTGYSTLDLGEHGGAVKGAPTVNEAIQGGQTIALYFEFYLFTISNIFVGFFCVFGDVSPFLIFLCPPGFYFFSQGFQGYFL